MKQAIQLVRTNFPFWNESHGANHFVILPTDQGICDGMARLLWTGEAEKMFSLQTQGSGPATTFPSRSTAPKDKAPMTCFRPGIDLVIPPLIFNGSRTKPISPLAHVRNVSVLLRHDDWSDHFQRVRPQLIHHFKNVSNFSGHIAAGWRRQPAPATMKWPRLSSVSAPQGQQCGRDACSGPSSMEHPRAGVCRKCATVRGQRAHWDSFSVEFPIQIAVNDTRQMSMRLQDLLQQPALIQRLQHGLAAVQSGLSDWDRSSEEGVQSTIVKALQDKAHGFLLFRNHRHAATCTALCRHSVNMRRTPTSACYDSVLRTL